MGEFAQEAGGTTSSRRSCSDARPHPDRPACLRGAPAAPARRRWLDEAFLVVRGRSSSERRPRSPPTSPPLRPPRVSLVFIFVSAPGAHAERSPGRQGSRARARGLVRRRRGPHPPGQPRLLQRAGRRTENGHKYLDDSNIDWGQDLKRLKGWMDGHPRRTDQAPVQRAGPPGYYGIRAEPVTAREWEVHPDPGWYAMSTQMLIRGELIAARGESRPTGSADTGPSTASATRSTSSSSTEAWPGSESQRYRPAGS